MLQYGSLCNFNLRDKWVGFTCQDDSQDTKSLVSNAVALGIRQNVIFVVNYHNESSNILIDEILRQDGSMILLSASFDVREDIRFKAICKYGRIALVGSFTRTVDRHIQDEVDIVIATLAKQVISVGQDVLKCSDNYLVATGIFLKRDVMNFNADGLNLYLSLQREKPDWKSSLNINEILKEITDYKYNVVYSQTSLSYNDKANAGNRGASHKFDVVDKDDLIAYDFKDKLATNCMLFMWATFPNMADTLEVMKAWGFQYKTLGFLWLKLNKNTNIISNRLLSNTKGTMNSNGMMEHDVNDVMENLLFLGMGNWTRSNAEMCLIGSRGTLTRNDASIRNTIFSPLEQFGKKPDCVRDKIDKLCGNVPKLEIFARENHRGWDSVGTEIWGDKNK